MRILHITEAHETSAGGIATVAQQLARSVGGPRSRILSVGGNPLPAPPGVTLTNVRPWSIPLAWRWSPALAPQIRRLMTDPGALVVHIHGVWLAAQWYGARLAQKAGRPFLVSAHGQLQPYHWTDRGWLHLAKKKAYWHMMAYPAFRAAQIVHAITPREKACLAELLPGQAIELIPNAADLNEIDRALADLCEEAGSERRPIVAFLGRFHPVKGVDLLIRAFTMAGLPLEWRLVLAGPPGDRRYMRLLEELAFSRDMRSRISFLGPLAGKEKWKLYRSAAVVAVPSLSEVIGMVNLEAAACGTPTITTTETGLDDWEEGGGVLIHPDAHELADALSQMASLSSDDYRRRSAASRRLIEERYSWRVTKRRWQALYESVAGYQH